MEFVSEGFSGPDEFWAMQREQVPRLLRTQAHLKPYHRLLDIGAGVLRIGEPLMDFLDPGNYYAIEPEEQALKEGMDRLSPECLDKLTCNSNVDFDLSVFGCKFDVILAHNVFIHCGRAQFRTCLRNIPDALEDDGVFVCSVFLDERDQEAGASVRYSHADYWIVFYKLATVEAMIARAGLRLVEAVHWGRGAPNERRLLHHLLIRKALP